MLSLYYWLLCMDVSERTTVQGIMPRAKGQTSEQRGDEGDTTDNETNKDAVIGRLTELVETQARQLERLIEREERRRDQVPPQAMVRQENYEPACERFRKNKPPAFRGETDPLLAEEWIRSIEGIFDYIRIPDEEKVSCATFMFQMDARHWWDSVKPITDLNRITWE